VKRYLCYFATMLLVLVTTDLYLGGVLFRFGEPVPDDISARLSSVNHAGRQFRRQKETEEENVKELGEFIASESCEFVQATFRRDKARVTSMLSEDTEYMISENNSSYIRYATEDMHVEGYMATDRNLVQVTQSWYVIEDDGTITSGVQVEIEGKKDCQTWYIHYRKSSDEWKIFMLENGI